MSFLVVYPSSQFNLTMKMSDLKMKKNEKDVVGNLKKINLKKIRHFQDSCRPSRGGLEVEAWTDKSLHSASVGLNPV